MSLLRSKPPVIEGERKDRVYVMHFLNPLFPVAIVSLVPDVADEREADPVETLSPLESCG